MNINVIEKKDGYIKFSVKGTDPHTLFNLLREELLIDSEVDFAGYWRDESFYESLIFQVRLKDTSKDPVRAIDRALERMKSQANEFISLCKNKLS